MHLDKRLELEKCYKNLYHDRCLKKDVRPADWVHFLNLFFHFPTIKDIPRSNFRNNFELLPLGKFNDFIIFLHCNGDINTVIIESTEFQRQLEENKSENIIILILNPTTKGLNISIYSIHCGELVKPIKVIHFPPTHIPEFFHDILELNQELSPAELIQRLLNQNSLEDDFYHRLMNITANKRHSSLELFLGYITILLLSYELLKTDDFLELLDRKEKKSRYISFGNYFSFLRTLPSQHYDIAFSLAKISKIITHLALDSLFVDMKLISNLLKRYPFSLNEPTSYIQEVAISPFNLSSFEETNFDTIQRKKQGKFYTKMGDADFVVQLAIFRFLENKILGIDTKILFESVFFCPRTTLPQETTEISKKDRMRFNSSTINVLDPSCGSGTFLVSATRLLLHLAKYNLINEKTTLKLQGFDTNQKALLVARLRLIFLCMYELSCNSSFNRAKNSRLPLKVDIDDLINADFLFYPIPHKYDLIFGNPPFVRQEDIGSNHVTDYKENLIEKTEEILGSKANIDKKSDLYVYFCLLGLSLLKNGGILAYLTSNAWLEVKYGLTLQTYLLDKRNRISRFEIMQRSKTRLWSDIGINSIFLIGQKANENVIIERDTLFIDSKVNFYQIPRKSLLEGLISRKNYEDEHYRVERIQRDQLSGTHKWGGTFLRTNKQERTLLHKISSSGASLSSVTKIRFGIKTGSNTFFHLQIGENDDILKDDKLEFMRNKLDFRGYIEKEYLLSLVKSPVHFKTYVIPRDFEPDYWLFYCTSSPEKLKKKMAWKYIQWGEKAIVTIQQGKNSGKTIQGFQSLKSISTRDPWYSLPQYPIPTLLWTKSYHDKPGCLLNLARAVPDQRFYGIIVFDEKYIPLIFTYLNSSLVWAQMESQGNTNMGYGVLDTNVYWLKNLKIPTSALKENKQIKLYMKRLLEEKERVPINSNSELRKDIDRFYSKYLDIDDYSLECLNKYICKSVNNRIK
jgi:hypothetical protein